MRLHPQMKNQVDVDQHKIREAADHLATSALLEKGRNWADFSLSVEDDE